MGREPTLPIWFLMTPSRFGIAPPPANNGLLLLVSCSGRKNSAGGLIPASERYTGQTFRYAKRLAEKEGLTLFVLSAKFGIIPADQPIPNYNQKLKESYAGPWPKGKGYYIGSPLYFSNVPKRFLPVLPKGLSIGLQYQFLKRQLIEGFSPAGGLHA
jgi:hypothetical protein